MVVIGGGIAGVSVAYQLSSQARVVLLEQEDVLAYHTTGRSAAGFSVRGPGTIRPLTIASLPFLENPPDDLVDGPLLAEMGVLTVAQPDSAAALEEALRAGPNREVLDANEAVELCPALRREKVLGATWAPESMTIDVAALHQAFVRGLRRNGSTIRTGTGVTDLSRVGKDWHVSAGSEVFQCAVVVNAAGAWADPVAAMAGARPVGVSSLLRTVFTVTAPSGAARWPMVIDAGHRFYFRPEGPQLLCSPADETPSPPTDARAAEMAVAIGIERLNEATTLGIKGIRTSWAGLRTFSPDRTPVIGFDPEVDGFFWLVGLGGSGIQTAPAVGKAAASLVLQGSLETDLTALGLVADDLSPGRFTTRSKGTFPGP